MKKLLIVVDFQNDFVNGSLGFEKAPLLDDLICEKIKEYKNNNDDIIYTFDTHGKDYMDSLEGHYLPIPHCIEGEVGHQLYGNVGKMFDINKDIYFNKSTFPSLELGNYLKDKKYKEIELCGLVSNICALSNVVMVKSALPNSKIKVNRKLTGSSDEKLNEYTFEILKSMHIDVI